MFTAEFLFYFDGGFYKPKRDSGSSEIRWSQKKQNKH